jgi:hypothetical protein
MTHFKQLKEMLDSIPFKKYLIHDVRGQEEPSALILIDDGENPNPIVFAFDAKGALWNVHIHPSNLGRGSSWGVNQLTGLPVPITSSGFTVKNQENKNAKTRSD